MVEPVKTQGPKVRKTNSAISAAKGARNFQRRLMDAVESFNTSLKAVWTWAAVWYLSAGSRAIIFSTTDTRAGGAFGAALARGWGAPSLFQEDFHRVSPGRDGIR